MLVGDHQAHPGQAALLQPGQEAPPEHLVLAVADVQAEDLPATVGGDAGGDHDGLGHHHGVLGAHVQVGRVQVHVRELVWSRRRVRNAPTTSSSPAQIRETSDLEIPVPPNATTRSSTERVGHAVDVGLHHHRVQRLVDPPPRRQDAREERPGRAASGTARCDVTGLGGQQPRPGPVAFGHPRLGAFVAAGADRGGRLGLDQLLHHDPDTLADQVDALAGAEHLQQLGQGRLRQGHR